MAAGTSTLDRDFADAAAISPMGWHFSMEAPLTTWEELLAVLKAEPRRDEDIIKASTVVYVAARTRSRSPAIVAAGIVPALVPLISDANEQVARAATDALVNLSLDRTACRQLQTPEFLASFKANLLDDGRDSVLTATLFLLAVMGYNEASRAFLFAEAQDLVVARTVHLLQNDTGRIAELAARSINRFAESGPARKAVYVAAGVTASLCDMLKRPTSSSAARDQGMQALGVTTDGLEEMAATMESVGVTESLVAALSGGDDAAKLAAASCLVAWCDLTSSPASLGTNGILGLLIGLLPGAGGTATAAAAAAAKVLKRAAEKEEFDDAMLSAVPGLVAMLGDLSTPLAAENAAACVDAMLQHSGKATDRFLASGGLPAALAAARRGVACADTVVEAAMADLL